MPTRQLLFSVGEKARADAFQTDIETLRANKPNPVPDLAIETRRRPEIATRRDGDDGIVHIIIRDFHLTNRSSASISIEAVLKFNIGGTTLTPNQDDMPLEFVEAEKVNDPSIGKHLGRRISLSVNEGVTGYLSYRIFDPITRAIAAAHSMEIPEFLNTREQILEIREHVSGVTKSISFDTFGIISFRDIDQP